MATLERLAPPSATPIAPAWNPRRAIVVALMVTTTIALLQVVQSSSFAHTGREMQRLEVERGDLTAQIHELESEVAALSSLERTERAARDRLGMVPAGPLTYLSVEVEAPDSTLLPRPLVKASPAEPQQPVWWHAALESLFVR